MEQSSNCNMLERFYLNNCRKIFSKFLDVNIGIRDVVLMGDDGTRIKCHRFVLSACSPFFERAFDAFTKATDRTNVGGTELVLLLATYKSQNVQRMVDYIYHGQLSDDLNRPSDKVGILIASLVKESIFIRTNSYFRTSTTILFVWRRS